MSFTLEDLLQWGELSPSLQDKFNKMTKEEIENFFNAGGYLDNLMKKYLFLNLPPKIGYGKNTMIDIKFGNDDNPSTPATPTPVPEDGINHNIEVNGKVHTMRDKNGKIVIWYSAYSIDPSSTDYGESWIYKQEYDEVNKRLKSPIKVKLPNMASENITSIGGISSVYYNYMIINTNNGKGMYVIITNGSSDSNEWVKYHKSSWINIGAITPLFDEDTYIDISANKTIYARPMSVLSKKHKSNAYSPSISLYTANYSSNIKPADFCDITNVLSYGQEDFEDYINYTQNLLFKNYKGNFNTIDICIGVDKDEKEILLSLVLEVNSDANPGKVNPQNKYLAHLLVTFKNVDFNDLYVTRGFNGKNMLNKYVKTDFALIGSTTNLDLGWKGGIVNYEAYPRAYTVCTTYNEKYKEFMFTFRGPINRTSHETPVRIINLYELIRKPNEIHNSWNYFDWSKLHIYDGIIKAGNQQNPASKDVEETFGITNLAYAPLMMSDKDGKLNVWTEGAKVTINEDGTLSHTYPTEFGYVNPNGMDSQYKYTRCSVISAQYNALFFMVWDDAMWGGNRISEDGTLFIVKTNGNGNFNTMDNVDKARELYGVARYNSGIYWDNTTDSYIVVYTDTNIVRMNIYNNRYTRIKSLTLLTLPDNFNDHDNELANVSIAFDTRRNILFVSISGGLQAYTKNHIILLAFKDVNMADLCTNASYNILDKLVGNISTAMETSTFYNRSALAKYKSDDEFPKYYSPMIKIAYDYDKDYYYITQHGADNVDLFIDAIDASKCDVSKLSSNWNYFNMSSNKNYYNFRIVIAPTGAETRAPIYYTMYYAYTIVKNPENLLNLKDIYRVQEPITYHNDAHIDISGETVQLYPTSSSYIKKNKDTYIIKNRVFNSDRTINYEKSYVAKYLLYADPVNIRLGTRKQAYSDKRVYGGINETARKITYNDKEYLCPFIFKDTNDPVIKLLPAVNYNLESPTLPVNYDGHYSDIVDEINKTISFSLKSIMPNLTDTSSLLNRFYTEDVHNIYCTRLDNSNIYSIVKLDLSPASYTTYNTSIDLSIGHALYVYYAKDNEVFAAVHTNAGAGKLDTETPVVLTRSGNAYIHYLCTTLLNSIKNILNTYAYVGIRDIGYSTKYGYYVITCVKKSDNSSNNTEVDNAIIIASTKDTITGNLEYTKDQFFKEGKLYYEIYPDANASLAYMTKRIIYNKRDTMLVPQIEIPKKKSGSASIISGTPVSLKSASSGTRLFSSGLSTTSARYNIQEASVITNYRPPFIMSDKTGKINMWYIILDKTTSMPAGLYKASKDSIKDTFKFNHNKVRPKCFEAKNLEIVDIIGIQYEAIFVAGMSSGATRWYMIKTNGSGNPSEWTEYEDITDIIVKHPNCSIYWTNDKFSDNRLGTWIVFAKNNGDKYRLYMYDNKHKNFRYREIGLPNDTIVKGDISDPPGDLKFDYILSKKYIKDSTISVDQHNTILFVDDEEKLISLGMRLTINDLKAAYSYSTHLLFEYKFDSPGNDLVDISNWSNDRDHHINNEEDYRWGLYTHTPYHRELSAAYDTNLKTFNISEHLVDYTFGTYVIMKKSDCYANIGAKTWSYYPWNISNKDVYVIYNREKIDDQTQGKDINIRMYNIMLHTLSIFNKLSLINTVGPDVKKNNIYLLTFNDIAHKNRRCIFKSDSTKTISKDDYDEYNSILKKSGDAELLGDEVWSYKSSNEPITFYRFYIAQSGFDFKIIIHHIGYKNFGNDVLLPVPVKSETINMSNTDFIRYEYRNDIYQDRHIYYSAYTVYNDLIYGFREREKGGGYAYDIVCFDKNGKVLSTPPIIYDISKYNTFKINAHDYRAKEKPPEAFDYYGERRFMTRSVMIKDDNTIYAFVVHIVIKNDKYDSIDGMFVKYIKNGNTYKVEELPLLNKYKKNIAGVYPLIGYNDKYGWFIKFEFTLTPDFTSFEEYNERGILIISSKDTLENGKPYTEEEFFNGKYYKEFYPLKMTYTEILKDDSDKINEDNTEVTGLKYTIKPTPIFLGGYYTDLPETSGDLIDNSTNYIYLYRDSAKWREVKVEVTKSPLWAPPVKNNKVYSDPLRFDKVLVAMAVVKDGKVISKTIYPVGDSYLYLNFEINH